MQVVQLLEWQGSCSTRYSGELAARAAGNTVLQKGMVTSIGQYTPVLLPGEAPSLTEKPLEGHSPQGYKELDTTEVTLCAQTQDFFFFCLWQLCPCEG